ncbi:MAG: COX15/CtaA family protein, partial [Pseudomonadota bacterium]
MKHLQQQPISIDVRIWLILILFMVLGSFMIGAITRLSGSGLSMVEWRPLLGWIPPLSEGEWMRIFDLYKQTSQFEQINAYMDIEDFKGIFWWEYIHRVWGRLIGIAYIVPLIWFWYKNKLPKSIKPTLIILLCLGCLQGFIGWWMVKSGFVGRSEVAPQRLAIHLGVAMLILAIIAFCLFDSHHNGIKQNMTK